ncbi:MAG: type II toxin-antitoxin system prevent-host-death family antitoxin [Chloroflexi bacterium]|nr:type II toxin-antitoxin system prevent-host-death family antitoxin [Chloroflexota bacterium]
MDTVTIRELRNRGRAVIDRVEAGESLIVSRDGRPVAELRPLPRKPLDAATLLERWRHLPPADPDAWRRDVDSVVDQSL